jgi:GTP-sensing pleiotropic transcriptional regulator CodY
MQILRNKIEENKKEIRSPDLLNQAYLDLMYVEIDSLQGVLAEIHDTEEGESSLSSTRIIRRRKCWSEAWAAIHIQNL